MESDDAGAEDDGDDILGLFDEVVPSTLPTVRHSVVRCGVARQPTAQIVMAESILGRVFSQKNKYKRRFTCLAHKDWCALCACASGTDGLFVGQMQVPLHPTVSAADGKGFEMRAAFVRYVRPMSPVGWGLGGEECGHFRFIP